MLLRGGRAFTRCRNGSPSVVHTIRQPSSSSPTETASVTSPETISTDAAPIAAPYMHRIVAPPMVFISGEEMTRYTMELIMENWVKPYLDTSNWEYFDLSCKNRDATNDRVLRETVDAGKRLHAIFKEPTITPTAAQVKEFNLKKAWGSPNGAMRRGWNGMSISRDTIHIRGIKLGFDKPVLFDRHAVGGEYGAGWKQVGAGRLVTTFFPDDGSSPILADDRVLTDANNVVVTYHNPLDNIPDLAHHFFQRCLNANVKPYVVTKKTVFKWQEGFWTIMRDVFDEHYQTRFIAADLVPEDGNLPHLISDAATMQVIRWTKGGFGMCAHNYDGDILTDEIAQVHRSPGFITSNLIGQSDDGSTIKECEASHGTVSDMWQAHLRGEETSLNPLGMIEALVGAMEHATEVDKLKMPEETKAKMRVFIDTLRRALHNTFRYGQGTRDMTGAKGLTTEQFVEKVALRLGKYMSSQEEVHQPQELTPDVRHQKHYNVDRNTLSAIFDEYDTNHNGTISLDELETMLTKLGVAPLVDPSQKPTAADSKK